jgi:hypothetical protein
MELLGPLSNSLRQRATCPKMFRKELLDLVNMENKQLHFSVSLFYGAFSVDQEFQKFLHRRALQ